MIAPCHGCNKRTAVPNCHKTCEEYNEYKFRKDLAREKRRLHYTGDNARIEQAVKRKISFFKQRRK